MLEGQPISIVTFPRPFPKSLLSFIVLISAALPALCSAGITGVQLERRFKAVAGPESSEITLGTSKGPTYVSAYYSPASGTYANAFIEQNSFAYAQSSQSMTFGSGLTFYAGATNSSASVEMSIDMSVSINMPMRVNYASNTGHGNFSGTSSPDWFGQAGVLQPGTYTLHDEKSAAGTGGSFENFSVSTGLSFTRVKKHLIVATHGWNSAVRLNPLEWVNRLNPFPSEDPDSADWPQKIVANHRDRLNDPGGGDRFYFEKKPVVVWNGTPTHTPFRSPTTYEFAAFDWNGDATHISPIGAVREGKRIGTELGIELATQEYDSVHLIGHSAGAWLIDAAADAIKAASPTTKVQLTFIDAYTPGERLWSSEYSNLLLGDTADFAEHYVDTTSPGYTRSVLPNAFNIDITALGETSDRGHSWPWKWYLGESKKESPYAGLAWDNSPASGVFPSYGNYANYTEYDPYHWSVPMTKGGHLRAPTGEPMRYLPDPPTPGQPNVNFAWDNASATDPQAVTDQTTHGFTLSTVEPPPAASSLQASLAGDNLDAASPYSSQSYQFSIDLVGMAQNQLDATLDDDTWYDFYLSFSLDFLSDTKGMLAISFDDAVRFQMAEEWIDGIWDSEPLLLGAVRGHAPHTIRFDIFSGLSDVTRARVDDISLGFALTAESDIPAVPEPSGLLSLGIAAAGLLSLRRR